MINNENKILKNVNLISNNNRLHQLIQNNKEMKIKSRIQKDYQYLRNNLFNINKKRKPYKKLQKIILKYNKGKINYKT